MTGCKKLREWDIQRVSFSILQKKKLKNCTFRIIFWNFHFQNLIFHHLQYAILSKAWENIPAHKGHGKSEYSALVILRPLGQYCIKNWHVSVMEITAGAQEHFQKSLSLNSVHHAIQTWRLKHYCAKKKPYVDMIVSKGNGVWEIWNPLLENTDAVFSGLKTRGSSQLLFFSKTMLKCIPLTITKAWLQRRKVLVLDWPVCSPDLPASENITLSHWLHSPISLIYSSFLPIFQPSILPVPHTFTHLEICFLRKILNVVIHLNPLTLIIHIHLQTHGI